MLEVRLFAKRGTANLDSAGTTHWVRWGELVLFSCDDWDPEGLTPNQLQRIAAIINEDPTCASANTTKTTSETTSPAPDAPSSNTTTPPQVS